MILPNDINRAKELFDLFSEQLETYYPQEEIKSILYLLFEEYCQMKRTDIMLNPTKTLSESQSRKVSQAIDDLKKYKPIQYIIGKTNFYGLDFIVTPAVLIPRAETEELVQWIIEENESYNLGEEHRVLDVLDIGSSSGCISISVSKNISKTSVLGIDINEEALKIAVKNNELNNTNVDFKCYDILDESNWAQLHKFDIIVSNPPYIRESERQQMSKNVIDYEPESALFVSDEDPLIFYRTILKFSQNHLKPRGKVYFEINEAFGEEMRQLLIDYGFSDIVLKRDMNGRDRMVVGSR